MNISINEDAVNLNSQVVDLNYQFSPFLRDFSRGAEINYRRDEQALISSF